MNKNKKSRYKDWLSRVKAMADKYGITLDQAINIIDGPGIKGIRRVLNWAEAEEFINYYLYSKKQ